MAVAARSCQYKMCNLEISLGFEHEYYSFIGGKDVRLLLLREQQLFLASGR
jgi:hypothetical protein